MKKFIFLLLATAIANVVLCQQQMDKIVDFLRMNESKHIYSFYFSKGNSLAIRMSDIKQLNYLVNVDSIFKNALSSLEIFKDSLKKDGVTRYVQYIQPIAKNIPPKINITTYRDDNTKNYSFQNSELIELKVKQDSFSIITFTDANEKYKWKFIGEDTLQKYYRTIKFTFYLNNIADLDNMPDSTLSMCINRIKKDMHPYLTGEKDASKYEQFRATYNMVSDKRIYPKLLKDIAPSALKKKWLEPNIYGGFQYARGIFIPSFAAGLRFTQHSTDFKPMTTHLHLMWEPHFFFSRNTSNKLVTDRNDFITAKYVQMFDNRKTGFDFVSNLSLGYLIRRKGDWFEKNTFKLGIPGVRSEFLQIEPEFFFNDFFRNFSPSLKLTLNFE